MNQQPKLTSHRQRLTALRGQLARQGLDGFIVPLADEHLSEYVAPYAQRLAWLTGFLGSAGTAVVLPDEAAIFVDGRYTIQVRQEVDGDLFTPQEVPALMPVDWLRRHAKSGARIGYDPWLHGAQWLARAREKLAGPGIALVAVGDNPIDAIWQDRPAPPDAPAYPLSLRFSGQPHGEKLAAMALTLADDDADAVVLSALDSIAWTFNIRGSDVAHTPVAMAFAIVHRDQSADLFIDPAKRGPELAAHLGQAVRLHARDQFVPALKDLGAAAAKVRVDLANTVAAIVETLEQAGAQLRKGRDPAVLPKACKNPVEQEGMRQAHIRDGAALCDFLAWFAQTAPQGGLTEIDAADALLAQRQQQDLFRDLSFRTIAAAGPHGAITHYSVSPASNIAIEPGSLFLLDSGGQYLDGTTDVTRTIAVGAAPNEARRNFTLVLKGHIALARARFPVGTSGQALDSFARAPLWRAGLDFDHGTGHGVGSFLGVHEGPQRIGKAGSDEVLKPGMVLSNEPGYYKADNYGIRIENLVMVVDDPQPGDERPMLALETLTLAPIDRALIDPALLDAEERAWLDGYHGRVRAVLGPLVAAATAAWLADACAPL